MKNWLRHIIVTVLAFGIVGIFTLMALNFSFLNPIAQVIKDFEMTDVFYQILLDENESETNDDIVIVDMSEIYSRRELAKVLSEIEAMKPKVIGVDVVFEGLKEDSVGDQMIKTVIVQNHNIVLSYKLLDYVNDSIGYTEAIHSFFVDEVDVVEGFTNMERNLYGGMKRELSLGKRYDGKLVPSFIIQTAERYAEKNFMELDDKNIKINFTPTRFTMIPADSVSQYSKLLEGRLVLFGAMKDEQDVHYTPLGRMAGVELLAYSVQTLMHQMEAKSPPKWLLCIGSFLLALITTIWLSYYRGFALQRKNRWIKFLLSASVTKSIFIFLWMAFLMWMAFVLFYKCNYSVNLSWAFSGIVFLELARIFYEECVITLKEKKDEKKTGDVGLVELVTHNTGCDGTKETEIDEATDETVCEAREKTVEGGAGQEENQRPSYGDS